MPWPRSSRPKARIRVIGIDFREQPGAVGVRGKEFDDRMGVDVPALLPAS